MCNKVLFIIIIIIIITPFKEEWPFQQDSAVSHETRFTRLAKTLKTGRHLVLILTHWIIIYG